jgi:hypothetical protein
MACYVDSFNFLYVDDVLTSQETCTFLHSLLRGSFTFLYVDDVVPRRKHACGTPRDIKGMTLLFNM